MLAESKKRQGPPRHLPESGGLYPLISKPEGRQQPWYCIVSQLACFVELGRFYGSSQNMMGYFVVSGDKRVEGAYGEEGRVC